MSEEAASTATLLSSTVSASEAPQRCTPSVAVPLKKAACWEKGTTGSTRSSSSELSSAMSGSALTPSSYTWLKAPPLLL